MLTRTIAALLAVAALSPVHAENQMGYLLVSPQEAAGLPHNHGSLGMDVERAQQITDGGMTFDIIGVKQVRPGSPGAKGGFKPGDEIIAVNGRVFPSITTFAAYVGSTTPGTQVTVDYIPAGGGPGQAQRVAVKIGAPMNSSAATASTGLSTGTKVAIGAGAVALLGCYEMGCFTHHPAAQPASSSAPQSGPATQMPVQPQPQAQ